MILNALYTSYEILMRFKGITQKTEKLSHIVTIYNHPNHDGLKTYSNIITQTK